MNLHPFISPLTQLFLHAYKTQIQAETIAEAAGIDPGTFPLQGTNMQETWRALLGVMEQQGKLQDLVLKAGKDPTVQQFHPEFMERSETMEVYSKLVQLTALSALAKGKPQEIYRSSLPAEAAFEKADTIEWIIFNLLEYEHSRSRKSLLAFMWRVSEETEESAIREAIQDWIVKEAPTIKSLQLNPEVVREISSGGGPPSESSCIGIVIQPSKEDADKYNIGFYIDEGDRYLSCVETINDVSRVALEETVTDEIDLLLALFDTPMVVVEFYLPQSLLNLNLDQWKIQDRELIERCYIVIGTLDRFLALSQAKNIKDLGSRDKKLALKMARKFKGTTQWKFIKAVGQWMDRWKRFKSEIHQPLPDNILEINQEKVRNLDQLRIELQDVKLHCVAFTFTLRQLRDCGIEDLLHPVFLAGMPVIFWSREEKEAAQDPEAVRKALHRYMFDQFRNDRIESIQDIIKIVHRVRRNALRDKTDTAHLGRYLTFVLDNPEREIPLLKRTANH